MNIIKNWFDPIDSSIDKIRNQMISIYRTTTRSTNIEGEGQGIRMVIPTEEMPTSEQLYQTEEQAKKKLGVPVRIIALNPKEIMTAKLTWTVTIIPRDRKTSESSKLMFRAEVEDANALGLILNQNWKEERFAETWQEDSSKMFDRSQIQTPQGQLPAIPQPAGATAVPTLQKPKIPVSQEKPAAINNQ